MFAAPPPLLVIHLNRSFYSPSSAFPLKNPAAVSFGPALDLGPFCTSGELRMGAREPLCARATEGGTLGALKEGAAGPAERESYELVGFVNHLGGHSSGVRLLPLSRSPHLSQGRPY